MPGCKRKRSRPVTPGSRSSWRKPVMATTLRGLKSKRARVAGKAAKAVMLLLFSVGGRRIAARAEEVGGVWPWQRAVNVPSATPFITAVLRRGEEILPVFDLAGRLNVQVRGEAPLCLIAKRHDGPLAVCIDGDIPALHMVEESSIRPITWKDSDVKGTCRIGVEEIPIYSLAHLGLVAMNSARESGGGYAKNPGRG